MANRNEITVERINETLTFKRGEYVSAFISKNHRSEGNVTGISHAKREVKVKGVWFSVGSIYKCEEPVKPAKIIRKGSKLSKIVTDLNDKFSPPGGWGECDKVPTY